MWPLRGLWSLNGDSPGAAGTGADTERRVSRPVQGTKGNALHSQPEDQETSMGGKLSKETAGRGPRTLCVH